MPPKTGGERSGLCFKCLQDSAAGTESAAPLAVPGAAIGGRSRLGLADRCAKRFLLHLPRRRGEKRTLFQMLPGQCGRDGKRGPSCGARRGHRRAQPPRPCRPLRQKILAAPAAAAGREANSVSNASRAVRPGRKARPLLRCPARPSAGAAASALPTAAPKNPPCIRRRRRSDFLPVPFEARVQIPASKMKSPALSCGAQTGPPQRFAKQSFVGKRSRSRMSARRFLQKESPQAIYRLRRRGGEGGI